MVLVITGTITPMVKDSEIVIKNQDERLKQYKESLAFFIKSKAFKKIVFGENSDFPREKLEDIFMLADIENVQFEYLTFQGNAEQMMLHGKGYGEGEIMDYIFINSQLLKTESEFMKVTGRLKVDNIGKLVKTCKPGKTYMNIPNRTIRGWYDTRLYVMSVAQFDNLFRKIYTQVDDSKGEYLEVVYSNRLKECNIKAFNFPKFPRIIGLSGSTGAAYIYIEWKCKIKDLLSIIQFYQIK